MAVSGVGPQSQLDDDDADNMEMSDGDEPELDVQSSKVDSSKMDQDWRVFDPSPIKPTLNKLKQNLSISSFASSSHESVPMTQPSISTEVNVHLYIYIYIHFVIEL